MSVQLRFDLGLYPVEAVMGTAYVFIDRCYVHLDRAGDAELKVSLAPKPGTSAEAMQAIAGEFQNELLGQALRRRLAERHEKVREAIVARALFGAAPRLAETAAPAPTDEQLGVEPRFVPAETDDYLDDPLGIAVPWEEKYGPAAPAQGDAPPAAAPPAGGPERTR